jgi:hypothetical protein
MRTRDSIVATVLAAMLCAVSAGAARAFDEAKYPDWKGQWIALKAYDFGPNPSWDPNKAQGLAQQAPLTPQYQALHEASLADQAAGGAGLDRDYICMPPGMPRMMNVYGTMEVLVMPDTTYMLLSFLNDTRRIYTDGRDWPASLEGSYAGYSIGKWIDSEGGGRFDVLEIETRGFKGPRTLDSTSIPLHEDNQTVVKERISLDRSDPNLLHDDMTVIDHALTRPWTVAKKYRRDQAEYPIWPEDMCVEGSGLIFIGNDMYFQGADGGLMPAKKGQQPPDLTYFNRAKK